MFSPVSRSLNDQLESQKYTLDTLEHSREKWAVHYTKGAQGI